MRAHRRLVVCRGAPEQTAAAARRVVSRLAPEAVAQVAPDGRRALQGRLGETLDAVVLDLHAGLDPDLLGAAHGLVRGGGALVLRMPPAGCPPPPRPSLALHPHGAAAVGRRMWARLERALAEAPVAPPEALPPPGHAPGATPDQDAAVEVLVSAWAGPGPSRSVLVADRGRGKTAALGRALARARPARAALLDAAADGAATLRAFAGAAAPAAVPLGELLQGGDWQVVLVDEASRLPVPALQRLVRAHPRAHLAFATTTRGYEGTGRGFSLRFLPWLEAQGVPLVRPALHAPIRWAAGDPVEAFVWAVLALDAAPGPAPKAPAPRVVPPAALAADEPLLRRCLGLLVHAHYRTTPADLERLLDAPNLRLHASIEGQQVGAVNLLAREGGLSPADSAAAAAGRHRIRGHALADSLVAHLGRPEAGPWALWRSVRLAVHPDRRRRGWASALAAFAHDTLEADLFGTVFGATPAVLGMRRAQGYRLVRLGDRAGDRTGAPAVVMVRPVTPRARALLVDLGAELAWNLPAQLDLLAAEAAAVDPALPAALAAGLPADPPPPTQAQLDHALDGWLGGPRTAGSVHFALERIVAGAGRLHTLPLADQRLLEARVLRRQGWRESAAAAGLPTVRAAQRQLKRAVAALLQRPPPYQ